MARALLRPSHEYLPCHKEELLVAVPWGRVQVWREYSGPTRRDPECYFLRFLGSRGRAELATLDPADRLPGVPSEVWTVNPPGFGGTSGSPDLERYADAATAVMSRLRDHAQGRPIHVCGKSLGTAAAMLAAREGAASLVLRNVVALRPLMKGRYAWRTGGLSRLLASGAVPDRLDTIAHASVLECPALFLVSDEDRVAPPEYQAKVIERYAGLRRVLRVGGGHDERTLRPVDEVAYRRELEVLLGNKPAAGQ